ncbi:hypothetical protein OXPF_27790 [Oxobacter pfennigii]|uniref:Uncharacterized protein n=1 Tax=Oxobacter pfennigii TaxID=36849 RepID=A0A0P8YUH0_9CLOT|nr:hypothetical protein [Oxobacter pfennigii]KPU43338.1 hypothetical protein OXPF_27790 [Oxobacter pfennigii]
MEQEKIKMDLTRKERRLLEIIRNTQCKEMKISVQDRQPIKIEEVKKNIKL